jgi:hypothetical protein
MPFHGAAAAAPDHPFRPARCGSAGNRHPFLAFVSLSQVPAVDVKILATGLALGIVLDATVVRGCSAPALVALLGRANWWWLGRLRTRPDRTGG